MEEYQIQVKNIIDSYKEFQRIELTDYLIECLEKTLEDSFNYTDLCR